MYRQLVGKLIGCVLLITGLLLALSGLFAILSVVTQAETATRTSTSAAAQSTLTLRALPR
jgi:hypothetical protein